MDKDCNEILEIIRSQNEGRTGESRIPESDTFPREVAAQLALNPAKIDKYLDALKDSHHIFRFNIAKADSKRNIAPLDGFVIAEKEMIEKLLAHYEGELAAIYKSQKNREKSIEAIIKEYLPDMNILNNTTTGKVLNIVTMLREYRHFIDTKPDEFSPEYKENKLSELLSATDIDLSSQDGRSVGDSLIASDEKGESMGDLSMKGEVSAEDDIQDSFQYDKSPLSIEKAIKIYGLFFIIRHYFRKNLYKRVEELINENRFFDLHDLILIRGMLKDRMNQINVDPALSLYRSQIYRLDRTLAKTIRRFSL